MELVEVNPSLAKSKEDIETTVHSALTMIRCAMGESITLKNKALPKKKKEYLVMKERLHKFHALRSDIAV